MSVKTRSILPFFILDNNECAQIRRGSENRRGGGCQVASARVGGSLTRTAAWQCECERGFGASRPW
ncbi:hypothetical protein IF1G_01156 [Cordyceps javanica]|uniref:Uncharacterized protein n=1 Tax=Cordyceps javanica TaxID=43265 RepID=A0A545VHM7_9HYPO|nr:hypothetical protein IF1G_01156 [Cordyceps javanica]TQW12378.1 hypothetical protein IF2G_01109 [Cordyceps javanica]